MLDPAKKNLIGQAALSGAVTAILFLGVQASAGKGSPELLTFGLVIIAITWGGLLYKILELLEEKKAPAAAAPPTPTSTKPAPAPGATARELLGSFQGKGRLIDFLQEDLGPFEDAQIGAAVRSVHSGCKGVLAETMLLEPILREMEETEVTVPPGFDPSAIRLTGELVGQPPFRGVVKHRGWRDSKADAIIAPAEVEVQRR